MDAVLKLLLESASPFFQFVGAIIVVIFAVRVALKGVADGKKADAPSVPAKLEMELPDWFIRENKEALANIQKDVTYIKLITETMWNERQVRLRPKTRGDV